MTSRIPKSLLAIGATALMVLAQSLSVGSVAAATPTGAALAIVAPIPHSLIATKTTLSSRANPSVFGANAPLLVQIKPISQKSKAAPSGTLAVKVDGKSLSATETILMGPSTTNGADWSIHCVSTINPFSINCVITPGAAYLTALPAGNHTVQVFYSGDATYAASHSSILKQRILAVANTTKLTSTANPTVLKSVTKIANDRTRQIAPTGHLNLLVDGKVVPGDVPGFDHASGAAYSIHCVITHNPFTINCTFTLESAYLANLAAGDHTFQVLYSGDTHYGSSKSAILTEKITSK